MKKLFFLMFVLGTFTCIQAQVLQVSVTVEASHLPSDQQGELIGFGDKVEQYFNGYTWVEDEYEYDVECSARIIIETVQEKTYEKLYKAQFLISSSSGEVFYDRSWEFPYTKDAPLSHTKAQFDPLTHFLDFYAYMILAGELDTNDLLVGTPLYNQAQEIANQGLLSKYKRGWNQRLETVLMITNARTKPLREIKPDFFEALYELEEGNISKAFQLAQNVFKGLKKVHTMQPNNKYLQMFFNSHYNELAKLFRGHKDFLDQLVEIDSKHREAYRKMMSD